jgi:signal transduction histidine kinase
MFRVGWLLGICLAPAATALAIALRLSGYRQSESGDTQGAVTTLREAQRLAKQIGDIYNESMALNTLAISAFNIGAFNDSANYYSTALALARQAQLTELVALINLVSNARDATRPGDTIRLSAQKWSVVAGSDRAKSQAPGAYAALMVTDSGVGMDENVVRQCIEPFFTTKDHASGTGLGLSMVHALATQSGGDLLIDSQPGRGTTVSLLLPLL